MQSSARAGRLTFGCSGYRTDFGLLKSMLNRYHAGKCPSCRQGRLFLFRNLATDDVYGHCEECEWGYITPGDIETNNAFLTLLDDDDAEYATIEEISQSVWANYTVIALDDLRLGPALPASS